MFPAPDTSLHLNQVYLNGFLAECAGYYAKTPTAGGIGCSPTSFNPNSAALGTGLQPYPSGVWAMLGIWKDCNGDGFVGLGDQGLMEYRSELLAEPLDLHICPVTPAPERPPRDWLPPHNDGRWVREFLPIGWNEAGPDGDNDVWDVNDNLSRVWMDEGLPTSAPADVCRSVPTPRGTFHTIGGILDQADCYLDGNLAYDTSVAGSVVPEFASGYAAARAIAPWGEADDASAADVWDCSGGSTLAAQRVGNWDAVVRMPSASPTVRQTGSPAGTTRAVVEGTDAHADCRGAYDPTRSNAAHPGTMLAKAPYATEADVANAGHVRARSDETLRYIPATRGMRVVPEPYGGSWPGLISGAAGRAMDSDAGLGATRWDGLWAGNIDQDVTQSPLIRRNVLSKFDPLPAKQASFYAFVSPGAVATYALQMPSTSVGIYGSDACGSRSSGVWNGWQCDASQWYPEGLGLCWEHGLDHSNWPVGVNVCQKVGAPYNLRDVDCYDEATPTMRDVLVGNVGACQSVGDLV